MGKVAQHKELDAPTVHGLLPGFRGQVVLPGEQAYNDARKVWNGSIDRRPAVVLRCAGVADVRDGIRLAGELHLPLAVRGGGHNIAGFGTCDGGVVLDLSPMKSARVDPQARTARAEPGLVWAELDRETQAFGLAVTGGVMSSTGISGFTLGGGIGWLQRTLGLACDNLRGADLVTVGGEVVRAGVGEQDTAYGHRDAPFILNINTRWRDRAETDLHVAHTRELWEAALPFTHGGAYINFLGNEGIDRVRGLRAGQVPAPAGGEVHIRPGERVPAQPEHPPSPAQQPCGRVRFTLGTENRDGPT